MSLRVVRGEEVRPGHALQRLRTLHQAAGRVSVVLRGRGAGLRPAGGARASSSAWAAGRSFLVAMETDLGPVDSLRGAWALTKGHKWSLFWIGLVTVGMNILGLLALGVGIILTMAVTIPGLGRGLRRAAQGTARVTMPGATVPGLGVGYLFSRSWRALKEQVLVRRGRVRRSATCWFGFIDGIRIRLRHEAMAGDAMEWQSRGPY